MRRLAMLASSSALFVLATAGVASAQVIGPTPGPTGTWGTGTAVPGSPLPGTATPTPLPQTGTALALMFAVGLAVLLLGLWAARRRAES